MTENWLPVVGYEGLYEVSDQGRVKSLTRMRRGVGLFPGRILSLNKVGRGRQRRAVLLYRDGARQRVEVHRLVAAAFIGACPDGMEVCHNDGDPTNNRVENLRYDTHQNNQRDMVLHGTNLNARKTHCPQGHPYDEMNTYWATGPSGRPGRHCRACRQARDRARQRPTTRAGRQRNSRQVAA